MAETGSCGSKLRRDCGLYSQDGLTRGMKSAECGNWFGTSRHKSLPPGVNDCAKAFQGSGSGSEQSLLALLGEDKLIHGLEDIHL